MTWVWTIVYLFGAAVAGRVAFVLQVNGDGRSEDNDEAFIAVAVAVLWPMLLALAVILAPFVAAGWAFSRPTRKERERAKEHERVREQAKAAKLAREYNLPEVP